MGKKLKGKNRHQIPSAAKTAAQPRKLPRVEEKAEFWGACPIWSFALIDMTATFGGLDNPFGGWIHLKQTDLDELLARFQQWEKMTWAEILAEGGRKRNHPVDVSQMIAEAQERLRFLKLDDYEQLLSLGVNSRARVYGILDRATFRLLWWDRNHGICPSEKKGT